jgi:ubiquinone/menaquinone biosynthesis C-methylase UbiE
MRASEHWDARYRGAAVERLSWFEPTATMSLDCLDALGVDRADSVIDVGGGVSPLAGDLLDRGFRDVTVLDVSQAALDTAARRLACTNRVQWLAADVRTWQPERTWMVWHDRATFHFLTNDDDRRGYLETMSRALAAGGGLVLATFASDGPDRCSGLPVRRYDAPSLLATISSRLDVELITEARHVHLTPTGAQQPFTWIACRRRA